MRRMVLLWGLSDYRIRILRVSLLVKQRQNRGIGKKLMDELKKHKTILHLHVYEKNEKALRFYQREHFTILTKETMQKQMFRYIT